jgi:hypothetical protein
MARKHARISEGATFEEVEEFLLKLTRQLRTVPSAPHTVKDLDEIEARVAEIRKGGKAKLTLV